MTNAPEETPGDPGKSLRESLAAQAGELQANFQRSGSAAAASYTLIGAIVLLGGAGYLADLWLGTNWLLLAGLVLGIVVGFYELAKVVWRRTP